MEPYHRKHRFLAGYLCGLLTVVGVIAVIACVLHFAFPGGLNLRKTVVSAVKLNELASLIGENYLEDVDQEILLDGAFAGYAQAVGDKYTRYYSPEEYEEYLQTGSGTFAGIGVTVQWDEERGLLHVLEVHEGGPADQAGVLADDYIYAVDGEVMENVGSDTVVSRIKGKVGTQVVLSILREGSEDPIDLTVTRDLIEETTVTGQMMDDEIGYIQLSGFVEVTTHQFKDMLLELKEQGMKGLILDLRGNPGGRLNVVVDIADLLLPDGTITYTMTKSGEKTIFSSDADSILDVPMVVLIDENSASASEILAGAIRDYGVGTLVGTTTFGKGIVQTTYSLLDNSAVKVTMARYYTPNGDYIHGKGIDPDIEVQLPKDSTLEAVWMTEKDTQYAEALQQIRSMIEP